MTWHCIIDFTVHNKISRELKFGGTENDIMEKIKAQRLSNWESQELREAQCRYAATDAWCCIHIYEEFNRLSKADDYELVEF